MDKIIDRLKKNEEYSKEHGISEKDLIDSLKKYFYNNYGIGISGYVWGDRFGFERDLNIAYGTWGDRTETNYVVKTRRFKFTIDVLYKFCKDFDAEFLYTTCDGDRYVFSFKNIDLTKAIL